MQSRSEESQTMDAPIVLINGRAHSLSAVAPYISLLDWLRDEGLTGDKEGCAEGECGACAVLVAAPGVSSATEWTAVNACLIPAWNMAGGEIITSEGLGDAQGLHPVQREMALRGGSQCGYCTPGFVCSMAGEYYRPSRAAGSPAPGADEAPADEGAPAGGVPAHGAPPDSCQSGGCSSSPERGPNGFDLHALSGNLCRCTGYRPIVDAAYALGTPDVEDPLRRRMDDPPP